MIRKSSLKKQWESSTNQIASLQKYSQIQSLPSDHFQKYFFILIMPKSSQSTLQNLLLQQLSTETQLKSIQAAIQNLQNSYLQKFSMGNLILGWENFLIPIQKEKPHIYSKDKLFSQSSLVSPSSTELLKIQDQNIQPFGQHRFTPIKKTNSKKNKKIKKNRK